jgi:hypothetical protein
VRIPKGGGTLIEAPIDEKTGQEIPPSVGILMADILPTGYFAAKQALEHPNLAPLLNSQLVSMSVGFVDSSYASEVPTPTADINPVYTFAVIGLGPVGVVSYLEHIRAIDASLIGSVCSCCTYRSLGIPPG